MIVVVGRARAAEGRRDELVAAAREMAARTRGDDGCTSYGFHADLDDADVVVGLEVWRDQASLDAHLAHEHTTDFLDLVGGLLAETPQVSLYDATARP